MGEVVRFPRLMRRDGQIRRLGIILEALPQDKAWKVTVEEDKPKRTLNQNALLWVLYQQVIDKGGEAMRGWEREDLHEYFLISHFGSETVEMFDKRKVKPLKRSSALSKIDFAGFVDYIVRFMASRGVVLDLPEDGWQS